VDHHGCERHLPALLDADPSVPSELRVHVEQCRRCQDLLEAHRRVAQSLRVLPHHRAPAELTLESVLERLDPADELIAKRLFGSAPRHVAPRSLVPPAWSALRRPRRRIRGWQLAAGLLAAALLLVGISLSLRPAPVPKSRLHVAVVAGDPAAIPADNTRLLETLLVYAPAVGLRGDAR
jgi:hypothetical protein